MIKINVLEIKKIYDIHPTQMDKIISKKDNDRNDYRSNSSDYDGDGGGDDDDDDDDVCGGGDCDGDVCGDCDVCVCGGVCDD